LRSPAWRERLFGTFAVGAWARRSVGCALAAAVLGGLLSPALADAPGRGRLLHIGGERKVEGIRVVIGKSETLRMETTFADLVVGNPEVADVVPLTDHSLYVLGKKAGGTNIMIYDGQRQVVGVVEVEVTYDVPRLAAELRRGLPTAKLAVSSVNGRIMLSGTVPDSVALDRALTIARQFGPDVVSTLALSTPQQVMLEVRFVEASRNASRELGIRWDVLGGSSATRIGNPPAPEPGLALGCAAVPCANRTINPVAAGVALLPSGGTPFGAVIANLLNSGGVRIDSLITALEEKGLARRLAEPNLVALSGDTASFLAGGEFPFPVQSTQNVTTIVFKRFGVGLAFTPTVLANGLINLKIEPEVSQLDPTRSVRAGGVEVPSLIVRRASTTIELRDGQSFAIAGLLQSVSSTTAQQLPWLGDVPVLGALFRSSAYQKNETDLVIIVTPRLVRPLGPGEVARTPFDTSRPANDVDLFLLGKVEVTPEMIRYVESGGPTPALTGHIIDLPGGAHAQGK
jgi:pilus assembly protein CpaC